MEYFASFSCPEFSEYALHFTLTSSSHTHLKCSVVTCGQCLPFWTAQTNLLDVALSLTNKRKFFLWFFFSNQNTIDHLG